MNKAKVIETLNSLPEEFKTEELVEKLLFLEKVENARQEVAAGKVLPVAEVIKSIAISLN
ncbi:hypothetical protein [Adhaeribacter soli]|uniref:Addiction module protein n=1 Tax=Adhaeribacter soli TaxID=2607655 RepID=A0A5N1J4U1_9BACT|nr:hypothetical protein [Adhaeribacter soli]KAA9340099.1 hypothetical protein F0P94_07040 [Adhaeribacter soli]